MDVTAVCVVERGKYVTMQKMEVGYQLVCLKRIKKEDQKAVKDNNICLSAELQTCPYLSH